MVDLDEVTVLDEPHVHHFTSAVIFAGIEVFMKTTVMKCACVFVRDSNRQCNLQRMLSLSQISNLG